MYVFHAFACGAHAFHGILVDHDPQAGNPFRKSLITPIVTFSKTKNPASGPERRVFCLAKPENERRAMHTAINTTQVSIRHSDTSLIGTRSMHGCATRKARGTSNRFSATDPLHASPSVIRGMASIQATSNDTGIQYKPVSTEDIPSIIRLWRECTPQQPDGYRDHEPTRIPIPWKSWMAQDDGVIVGAFVVWHDPEKGDQPSLIVSEDRQNLGIASGLLLSALGSPLARDPRDRFLSSDREGDDPLQFKRDETVHFPGFPARAS